MTVDGARRDDHAAGVDHRGARVEHDVDAVHRVRVAGPADRGHAAAGDADARPPDAEHRVEQQAAGDRDVHAAAAGAHAQAVAHRAAPAGEQLVRAADVVGLRLDDQAGVAELRHRGSPARVRAPGRARARRRRRAGRRRGPRGRARCARRRSGAAGRPWHAPGANVTFSPAGIASRRPQAAARSKRRSRFTSKKWKCDVTATVTAPSFVTSTVVTSPVSHVGATALGCGGASRTERLVQHQQPHPVGEQRLDLDPRHEAADARRARRPRRAACTRAPRPRRTSARRGPLRRARRRSARRLRPG